MRFRCLLLLILACTLPLQAAGVPPRPRYEVVGYIFGREDGGLLQASTIAAGKMTRINYAFFAIKNGMIAERGEPDARNLAMLAGLRAKDPALQIVLSVGGGGEGSAPFSDMALTVEGRRRFVDSAVATVKKYDLDGVDVDWEYPGYSNSKTTTVRPVDRENYTLLLQELRERFDREEKRRGRPLVTSSATGATQIWLDHTDMRAAAKWLTSVNLMCYDWYSSDARNTGHDSPLRTSAEDPRHISIDDAVRMYLKAGVPPRKIVVGVPFYGRRWTGVGATNHGLWQTVTGKGEDIEFRDVEPLIGQQGYVRFWDARAAAPTLYNAGTGTFVTYNDAEAERARTAYVKEHELGGVMFWEYTGDPRNTLLDAIDAGFGMSKVANPAAE